MEGRSGQHDYLRGEVAGQRDEIQPEETTVLVPLTLRWLEEETVDWGATMAAVPLGENGGGENRSVRTSLPGRATI